MLIKGVCGRARSIIPAGEDPAPARLVDHRIVNIGHAAVTPNVKHDGRFMSVDPFIHGNGNSQGINPYSYILNNPLAGTDPSGYSPMADSCLLVKGCDGVAKTLSMTNTLQGGPLNPHELKSGITQANGMDVNQAVDASSVGGSVSVTDLKSEKLKAEEKPGGGNSNKNGTGFFEGIGQRFSNLKARGQFSTDLEAETYDLAWNYALEHGGQEGLAEFWRENPPFGGTKTVIEMLSGAGMIRLAQGGKPIVMASDETISRWAVTYAKNSPNCASASLKESLQSLGLNAKGVLSPDGVKTVFSNSKFEVKVDNLFGYFRVRNVTNNQYVDATGQVPKTGHLLGKEADNFRQQQTHIRNLDP